jgi:hemerythrin-like domain-containing protein
MLELSGGYQMKAIDDLKHEHEVIGRVITLFEQQAEKGRNGEALDPALLKDGITFVRGFAVACHHEKEEAGLFPLLAAKNPIIRDGPVKVLTAEHVAGKQMIGQLEQALPGVETGDADAIANANRVLDQYTRMLRKHIEKENELFFILAEALMTPEEADQLAETFEGVEAAIGVGTHERFEALLSQMEASQV